VKELNVKRELSLVVIPNTVLLPGKSTTIKISKEIGNQFYKRIVQDDFYGVALALKEGHDGSLYGEDDFYHVGTLIKIDDTKVLSDGYEFVIDVIERVEVKAFIPDATDYKISYDFISDIIELDKGNQKEMIIYIKTLVAEISQNFRGSETYVEYINKLDDITDIISYLFPFMNLSFEDRQAFLEIRSLRRKSLRFLDILIEQKESIKFQMEIATKFNEKVNKNYRENMLRQQLKSIQEELDETEGTTSKKEKRLQRIN